MSLRVRTLLPYSLLGLLTVPGIFAASCARGGIQSSDFPDDSGSPQPGNDGGSTIPVMTPPSDDGGTMVIQVNPADGGGTKCNQTTPCSDFPATPIMDPNAPPPTDPTTIFGAAGTGTTAGGPCLVEPADNSLFPRNWLRPRFLWVPASKDQNVFEVRITSPGETNPLVIYTTNPFYTMEKPLWQTISTGTLTTANELVLGNLVGQSLTVTVRAASMTGGGTPTISNSATMLIAPSSADGALIYWTTASFATSSSNTTLQGFSVGDEGTTTALEGNQVQQPVRAQSLDGGNLQPASFNGVFCIGCHTATPDGQYVSFVSQWPWAVALANVQSGSEGLAPPWLMPGAVSNLSPDINGYFAPPTLSQVMMGIQTFSPAHYATGDRRLVASLGAPWNQTEAQIEAGVAGSATGVTSELAWFDLEYAGGLPPGTAFNPWSSGNLVSPLPLAPKCTPAASCATSQMPNVGWGIIARTGDTNSAGAPSWSHNADGKTDVIAYASTNLGVKDGRMDCQGSGVACTSDVYVVPYAGGAGGAAAPLPGASDPARSEYYPAFSPDDQLVAFNSVAKGTSMYNEPSAEVYVVPYKGGTGGTAVRLAANDPVACTATLTPAEVTGQVQNTWPKWAPNPLDANGNPVSQVDAAGNTYYWLTFSSTRSPTAPPDPANGMRRRQQLYVTGVVVAKDGTISTYAPIYLWNQDDTVNNLIPSWGEFQIPPGVKPPPPPMAQ